MRVKGIKRFSKFRMKIPLGIQREILRTLRYVSPQHREKSGLAWQRLLDLYLTPTLLFFLCNRTLFSWYSAI